MRMLINIFVVLLVTVLAAVWGLVGMVIAIRFGDPLLMFCTWPLIIYLMFGVCNK